MPKHIHLSRIIATTITVLGCVSVTGCAAVSAVGAVASMAGSAMEAAGLKKPENAPIEVKLAIHSGENLNASSGQAMAVVTKIYYLKNPESFQRTPPAQLIDTAQEKAALGETMLASRELTLTPGQRYENVEKVPKDAEYIAIAGLFYAPAPMRWKYVFRVKDVEDSGIVLGAHACALSVTTGKPTLPAGIAPYDPSRLSGVQCPG